MLYYIFAGVYVVACAFLLIVVLLQQGKGGDIASAFGGNSSQTAFGARAGATVLTRATTILGALFMVGALVLNIVGSGSRGGSVVSGFKAPAATAPAAPPLTVPTAPGATTTPTPPAATTPAAPGKDTGKTPAAGTNAPAAAPVKPPIKKGGGGQ
jgi:preprotein translocase subunit SecG